MKLTIVILSIITYLLIQVTVTSTWAQTMSEESYKEVSELTEHVSGHSINEARYRFLKTTVKIYSLKLNIHKCKEENFTKLINLVPSSPVPLYILHRAFKIYCNN